MLGVRVAAAAGCWSCDRLVVTPGRPFRQVRGGRVETAPGPGKRAGGAALQPDQVQKAQKIVPVPTLSFTDGTLAGTRAA
jgi:hypothetical protein